MAIEQSLPQLLADLHALRAEVDATGPSSRGGDPLLNTCNDLALAIMGIGGLNLSIPPQKSGKQPSAEVLLADMQRWREANASRPQRKPEDPIVGRQVGRRY